MTKLKKGKRVEGEQRAQVTADLVQRYEGGESIRSLAADCGRSYGFVQGLLKDAGDIVSAGEAIATVGTSGGQDTPALYFAIRQQGRPSDPAQWCRAQG